MHDGCDFQRSTGSQRHHHSQDHDAEDVVEHGRSNHDLTFAGAQITKLAKHTRSDTDAGGRHRSTGKNRLDGIHVEDAHQTKGSQCEGKHHAHHSHGEGLSTDGDQFFKLALQTREEQQREQTQIGNGLEGAKCLVVDLRDLIGWNMGQSAHHTTKKGAELNLCFRRHQQMQPGGANDHARQELAQDGGQFKTNQNLRKGSRRNEDEHEAKNADQRFGDLEVMAADLTQQCGKQHGCRRAITPTLVVKIDPDCDDAGPIRTDTDRSTAHNGQGLG